MLKILAPIDGSNHSRRVIDYLIRTAANTKAIQVFLINVRERADALEVGRMWNAEQIRDFQLKEGALLLQPASEQLAAAGIPASSEVLIGDIAPTIVEYAKTHACDMIVMGSRGMGAIANLLMGSVANKVLHLAAIPVAIIK